MHLSFLTPKAALVGFVVLLPVVILALIRHRSAQRLRVVGLPPMPLSASLIDAALLVLVIGLLALAAAQPVVVRQEPQRERADVEVFFIFDTSRSMLARASLDAPTRFERAIILASSVRSALPEVPIGIASFTDRILPHLFPTIEAEVFSSTLISAIGIERPPPKWSRERTTDFDAIGVAARGNLFSDAARTRIFVLFTDGESDAFDSATVRDALAAAHITLVLVHVWGEHEWVFDRMGERESYISDPQAPNIMETLAEGTGAALFRETESDALIAALRDVTSGRAIIREGERRVVTPLALSSVLLAFLPLSILIFRKHT